jgi:septal ring factor EnvC (AmiA/AmiB activator)
MPVFHVIGTLKHDGETFANSAQIELDADVAAPLIAAGALESEEVFAARASAIQSAAGETAQLDKLTADLAAAEALIAEQAAQLDKLIANLAAAEALLAERDDLIADLNAKLDAATVADLTPGMTKNR